MPNITTRAKGRHRLKALTDKQRRFVEEYVVDMNASQAAIRAGYSAKSSGLYAQMMGNRAVVAAVEDALAAKRARSLVSADRVVAELARVAFANVADLIGEDGRIDIANLPREAGAAVARVAVEYEDLPTPLDAGRRVDPPHEGEGRRCGGGPTQLGQGPSHPPHEGEGGSGSFSRRRVRRVAISMADKTAALATLVRCLGMDRGGWSRMDEEGAEIPERLITRVYTGVSRFPGDDCIRYMSHHPIARAVMNLLEDMGWTPPGPRDPRLLAGPKGEG